MKREEAVARLAPLAARRATQGFAADRSAFTTWALDAERLFVRALDSDDPVLAHYREAVKRFTERRRGDDLTTVIHSLVGAFDASKLALEEMSPDDGETREYEAEGQRVLVALYRAEEKHPTQLPNLRDLIGEVLGVDEQEAMNVAQRLYNAAYLRDCTAGLSSGRMSAQGRLAARAALAARQPNPSPRSIVVPVSIPIVSESLEGEETPSPIRLFISHSSKDKDLAERVVALLRSALNLRPSEIRCTSVPGYKFDGGTDTDEQVLIEVKAAQAVVGIISTASLESLYVAFELGARWGIRKPLIPLLAPGTEASQLRGPLGGKIALHADRVDELHVLVRNVASHLGTAANPPDSYLPDLAAILSLPKQPGNASTVGDRPRSAKASVSFGDLSEGEKAFLAVLWSREDTFLDDVPVTRLRAEHGWDVPTWNAIEHSLRYDHAFIERTQRWAGDRAFQGWELTQAGRTLLVKAHRAGQVTTPKGTAPNGE